MSEIIEKSLRLLFVFRHNKILEDSTKNELMFRFRHCIYVPLAFSIFSFISLLTIQKFRFRGNPITETRSVYSKITLSLFAGYIPGFHFYLKLVSKADQIFWDGVKNGTFSKEEIRLVQEREYFQEMLKSLRKRN